MGASWPREAHARAAIEARIEARRDRGDGVDLDLLLNEIFEALDDAFEGGRQLLAEKIVKHRAAGMPWKAICLRYRISRVQAWRIWRAEMRRHETS